MTGQSPGKVGQGDVRPRPSESFISLTRNPKLNPPQRFEPTVKGPDDVTI